MKFLEAFQAIAGVRLMGNTTNTNASLEQPTPEHPILDAKPFWPSTRAILHAGPQRWMFSEDWLARPENKENMASWVVPVD